MGLRDSRWASASNHTPRSWPRPQTRSEPDLQQPAATPTRPAAAPTPPVPRINTAVVSPKRELDRYKKLVARLKWKLPFLDQGYRIATARAGLTPEDIANNEIHFKIDFYEYYMHIERALVHLMAVFGIRVTGLADSRHNRRRDANGDSSSADRRARIGDGLVHTSTHRYHANVLAALDRPENPLYPALGVGHVRQQLARAKELRNRWKNADEAEEQGKAPVLSLEAYNLDMILNGIFAGFDKGFLLAQAYVRDEQQASASPGPMDQDEDKGWGFIADAMDWEAV